MRVTCEVTKVEQQHGGVSLTMSPARTNQVQVVEDGLRLDAPTGFINVQINREEGADVAVGDKYVMSLTRWVSHEGAAAAASKPVEQTGPE